MTFTMLLSFLSPAAMAAPLRFAATEMPKPDPCLPFITETHRWLDKNFPDGTTFRYYSIQDLEKAIRDREVDVVLSEAGVAGRLRLDGARPLFSAVSQRHKDPKRSQGSVFFVRDLPDAPTHVMDLKGKTLAATTPNDFTGFQAAMGELVRRHLDPAHFFFDVHFIGTTSKKSMQDVVGEVLAGRADAGVVRTCFLEDLERTTGRKLPLRVVEPREDPHFACRRSTELYPNWTISSVPSLSSEDLRRVMTILLAMPPTKDGMYWSVASDFSQVDKLMQDLRIGPYETLRAWTWQRIWREYGWAVTLLVAVAVLLTFHMFRTSYLLRKRTTELQETFDEKTALQNRVAAQEAKFEKLRRATAVGQMSNLFVHELKQPLQTISCFSHGLLRTLANIRNVRYSRRTDSDGRAASPFENDADAHRYDLLFEGLEKIENEVRHAGEIIEHVRNYAKGRETERVPLDLVGVFRNVFGELRQKYGDVLWTVNDRTDAFVLPCSELECQFVFHSVLKNAVEAASNNRIQRPAVEVTLSSTPGGFTVIVEDNGPRLDDADFERLLTPLSSSKPDGMGLGLTVTRSILEKYRGTLSFQRSDSGIRTILFFPSALSEEQNDASTKTAEPTTVVARHGER